MKDSGIEWIGEIPADWRVNKVFRLFERIGSGTTPISFEDDAFKGSINWIQSGDLNGGILRECKHKISKEILARYSALSVYKAPFIIVAMYGASVGNISISEIDGCVNQACCVLCEPLVDNTYAFYAIMAAQRYLIYRAVGGGQPNISQNTLKQLWIVEPPLSEQKNIASFLDRKCSEIDSLIALQEKMIEELKAYKQSVITEAVTKGLNPNVPMRDSGIDWIGEIPEAWKVPKMNYICNTITDFVASGSFESLRINVPYLDSPDYAMLVRTTDLSGSARSEKRVYISKHSYDFLRNSNLFGGEIILPNIGAVGDVYIVPKGMYERMSLAPNAIMFKSNYLDKFYFYYFYGRAGRQSILELCQSTAQPKFNKTQLRSVRVILPPLAEQHAIADYLDTKCADIDALIAIKQEKIDSLKEYKKSTIYEYVTGKKQVN